MDAHNESGSSSLPHGSGASPASPIKKMSYSTLAAVVSASVTIMSSFPSEGHEFTFALVGAAAFAALELSKPRKGSGHLAAKKASLTSASEREVQQPAHEGGLGVSSNDDDDASTTVVTATSSSSSSTSTCSGPPSPAVSETPVEEILMDAIGRVDPRAQELVSMVERWAEESGISASSACQENGRLPKLAWQLLAVYFLQVFAKGTKRLPRFDEIINSGPCSDDEASGAERARLAAKSVPQMFREFVSFYMEHFDWQSEAACVLSGRRASPRLGLSQNALACEDGFTHLLCPGIEDPFVAGRNLGNMLSAAGYQRIQEELAHADLLMRDGMRFGEIPLGNSVATMVKDQRNSQNQANGEEVYSARISTSSDSEDARQDSIDFQLQIAAEHPMAFRDFMTWWLMMPQSGVL